jgi:hypothetical protein
MKHRGVNSPLTFFLTAVVRSPAVTPMPGKPDGVQHLGRKSSIHVANQDYGDGPAGWPGSAR